MSRNDLIPNRIVRVVNGTCLGNKAGTIVKILSKPGRFTDQATRTSKTLYSDKIMNKVLCEPITAFSTNTLNNQPVCYEHLNDLVPATEHEKLQRKLYNQIPKEIIII